ncbi:predicted protein [Naegleria gruberi]|uniref:Predicted protein n=1 Tax=Naegleria gruberi TaxID=5762 RepID=D2VEZ8_NAEGR|nr:uncharacterized protein NAEGRDRAFT_67452 [Naegleria gruberi]EFC44594.1 predicted protein [Naegleria gruberi]|eukprot:XP_002677338.1 predicted protein [Naegleria gruberi strain NEG-M]
MINNRDDPILKEEEIETLSDLDELDELDNTQILEQFLSLLEVYENCLSNIAKLLEYVGKNSADSLSIRKDIKHEKDFALSLSKDLHELLYVHNSYITEHHNNHVVRYKKKMQELNILFQRFKDLEKQYPASNLPETTSSTSYYSLTPVYKKLSGYIFKQDETTHLEEELLKQHGIHDDMEMSHDKLDELKNDLKELVSVFETLEESSTKKDKRKNNHSSSTSIDVNNHPQSSTNNNNNHSSNNQSTASSSTSASQTSNGAYYGAAVVSLGLLAGSLIGGPVGMYVGGKLGASIMTTASLGSGIGMIGSGLLLAGKGYFSRQEKQPPTEIVATTTTNNLDASSSTTIIVNGTTTENNEHSEKSAEETTPNTPQDENSTTEESKKDK